MKRQRTCCAIPDFIQIAQSVHGSRAESFYPLEIAAAPLHGLAVAALIKFGPV